MEEKNDKTLINQSYKFLNIPTKKKRERIINLLSYCKEIRDTAYPLSNSLVTQLDLVEFTARKEEKDMVYVNGTLMLVDGDRSEERKLEAYIIEFGDKTNIYMDVIRVNVLDEPKMIRTSEELIESDDVIISVTSYSGGEATEHKTFSAEFSKCPSDDFIFREKSKQLSVL